MAQNFCDKLCKMAGKTSRLAGSFDEIFQIFKVGDILCFR